MADAMLDARQEDNSYRRIEVITGDRRRRRWSAEEKARIVAESFEENANISEVARRNGVARGLLTAWRRQLAAAASRPVPSFVPVRVGIESDAGAGKEPGLMAIAPTRSPEKASSPDKDLGVIEIEVSEARIRVGLGVELTTLSTVLAALRGCR